MKVLIAHARYALPGGEETLIDTQTAALTALGHQVVRYEEDNADLDVRGAAAKARTAATSVWSRGSRRSIASIIAVERPDVVHVHNHFPSMSPSVLAAANDAGVAVVQHLHNARLVCIQPFLVRDDAPCESCVGRLPLPGVVHRCYRGSVSQSAVAAAVQITHRALGTWRRRVDRYIAVSESLAATLRRSGVVPADKVVVCHNGLATDPGAREPAADGGYALYLGRLSYEKGVDTVVAAAALVPEMRVVIAGDGPERRALERRAGANVGFVGHVDQARVFELLRGARVTLAPSRGQEPFGIAAVEAAAVGVPTIASAAGGLREIVRDGESGILIAPSDPAALATAMRSMLDAEAAARMGGIARQVYEAHFSAAAFGERLVDIYDGVLRERL
jgi:glycosyltransferase involved in cell wall biosynthesis